MIPNFLMFENLYVYPVLQYTLIHVICPEKFAGAARRKSPWKKKRIGWAASGKEKMSNVNRGSASGGKMKIGKVTTFYNLVLPLNV